MKAFVTAVVFASSLAFPAAQTYAPDQTYAFLDTIKTSTMQKELDAAGAAGFDIHAASNLSVLLKRGEGGPRTYRLLATERIGTFENELNAVAAQGFRVVAESAMEFGDEIIAVLKKTDGGPWTYKTIKGGENNNAELLKALKEGWTFTAVLVRAASSLSLTGKPRITFLLERDTAAKPSSDDGDGYKVLFTNKTGTMNKEIQAAAGEGYRITGAGFMSVIMRRATADAPRAEYTLLAARRLATLERETNEAAAKGFRIHPRGLMVTPVDFPEMIFIMEREPRAAASFTYAFVDGWKKTANADLERKVSEGWVPVALLGRLIVMEKRRSATT